MRDCVVQVWLLFRNERRPGPQKRAEIAVLEEDAGGLSAQFESDRADEPTALLRRSATCVRGAGERDLVDQGVGHEGRAGVAIADDDVEDSIAAGRPPERPRRRRMHRARSRGRA